MGRALTIDDLFCIERLSQIVISPNGTLAWLVVRSISLHDNVSKNVNYRVDLATGQVESVFFAEGGAKDFAFSRDGQKLFFVADGHIYSATPMGGNVVKLTKTHGGASKPVPSPDGKRVLYSRSVYMNAEIQAAYEKTGTEPDLAQIYGLSHPKAKARVTDRLMYRHWDSWCDNKRNHLFILDVETGKETDLTPEDADVPPIALESSLEYDFSPDGKHIVFAMNPDRMIARSTNNSIYLMEIDGCCRGNVQKISDTDGRDTSPRFLSATKIGYSSMLTPGYEADAERFKVYDTETGRTRLYLETFERSIDHFELLDDGKLLFNAQDFGHVSLFMLDLASGDVMQLTSGRTYTQFTSAGGRVLASLESLDAPAECVELSDLKAFSPRLKMGEECVSAEKVTFLTQFGRVVSDVEMHAGICTHFDYHGTQIEGYIVTPPGFDESRKYPLILLIHGGPQGAFLDSFHYRWNVQMFAAQGAVVAFCNPHGSTGYGHELTRSISRHWSDDCPNAIMAFVDHVLKVVPQIDADRMTAAGASFGGFMINWLMGHTDRFKALVSHDGIFNTEMSGYITDELWFCDYEFGGAPYEKPESYLRHSPHRFVKNFRTPTLVVQGELDFRCFISEGVGLFTALQYMGVESRLLYFPNEGHWVLDPADSAVWYEEVVGWLMKHVQ